MLLLATALAAVYVLYVVFVKVPRVRRERALRLLLDARLSPPMPLQTVSAKTTTARHLGIHPRLKQDYSGYDVPTVIRHRRKTSQVA